MERSSYPALFAAVFAVTSACADGGPAGPPSPPAPSGPRIEFIAGHTGTDTVDAVLGTPLQIGVWGPSGRRLFNTVVHIETIAVGSAPGGSEVQAAGPEEPLFHDLTSGVTDLQGTLRFRVKLGRRAGQGRLVVRVPSLGITDTARYTIQPGAATRVQVLPADTVVGFGGRVPLRGSVADRYGNTPGDPLTLSLVSGPGALEGGAVALGSSIGMVTVVASAGPRSDTTFVRVAPPGTVAAINRPSTGHWGAIYTFSLDGSNVRTVRTTATPGLQGEMSVAWLGTDKLVYHDYSPDHTRQVYVHDLATGQAARFLPPADRMEMEHFPRASLDGNWVYFAGGLSYRYGLYRARADGSGKELLSSDSLPVYREWGADPSPDGTRIVYVKQGVNAGDETLHLMDLATRVVTPLNRRGVSPRWSPDGTRIAYVDASAQGMSRPALVNADGTGARFLSETRIHGDLSWSPDGRYLVGAGPYVYQLVVIDVAAGAEVALNYPAIEAGVWSPAWKP